jgi:prepilin-type N-terminal cleavage/methylation domain-containing protein
MAELRDVVFIPWRAVVAPSTLGPSCAKVTIPEYGLLALACVFLAETCSTAEMPTKSEEHRRPLVVFYCHERNISKMRDRSGFTLIEMAIAICIALLVLALAVPSVSGVLADRRLRRSLEGLNAMVRQAQERSISEHRSYLIVMKDKKFALRAEGLHRGEEKGPISTMGWKKGESFRISFPAAIDEDPPAVWAFWPMGTCEPAIVSYQGPDGSWTAKYSALTARPELTRYVVK